MNIQHNVSLKPFNTFGIDVIAKHFVITSSLKDLKDVLNLEDYPEKLILGGGSNILLTKDVDALVILVQIKGISIISKTEDTVLIKANAGENWHEFVQWTLQHNYGGLENLSLIPGNVGTSPIQNIGAYGVELKDVFKSCEALNINTKTLTTFSKTDCAFGYRNSVFKQGMKGQFIITSVTFKLTTQNHTLHTNYGAIIAELESKHIKTPTIQDVSQAIIAIRQSKLPDPKKIGNSGSFFKNPIVDKSKYLQILNQFPDVPSYTVSETQVKIPAGWLIEKAGFKGKRLGNYGVHKNQALVLVNYGGASGEEILKFSGIIQTTIQRIFNIMIESEVNIL
ncbi:UDP-N-acetylmuramate dehydrogenase [Formosa sediminum]|uniref:UDP-N-acetylenolpyruvoylglucosamine reductase n=1 Tax=Formosa sediminum TaxID=2594004 RepID=A0A516GQF3_9FLAO|nr:UDP-N-acetylmuramate dehydrogenase [Formosa sediminum]QDO93755.1 UDP-N-acetylmuramate dehydrogenase [Formosa sediminum]